ncbi:MAG: amidinotransferase [Nitrospirae bacterium]|nr:amidinotransferase [Nitrospirota bacterium]
MLMCPPDYFRIEYEINPWMSLKNPADQIRARWQWDQLYTVIEEKLQAKVELLDPQPGHPDLVFTANAGLVSGKRVWVSNFKYPERQGEQTFFREWFMENGYEVISVPPELAFEGEGDFLRMGSLLFAGAPFRTDLSSHIFISKELQCEVISLELIHPKFYHLDTCFCPLNDRSALFVPDAFSPSSLKILTACVDHLIPLKTTEANLFSANAIVSGNKIIFQRGAETTRKKLENEGFEVFPVDLSEFIKAGGSAKCLVLWL